MGTKRNKRSKRLSTRKVSQSKTTSVNLFEVRVNRKKHDILGQRLKSDRGLPGISRSKAIQKVCCTVSINPSRFITGFFFIEEGILICGSIHKLARGIWGHAPQENYMYYCF